MIRNAILNTKQMEKRMPVKKEEVKGAGLLSRTKYIDNQQDDVPDSLRLKKHVKELFGNG